MCSGLFVQGFSSGAFGLASLALATLAFGGSIEATAMILTVISMSGEERADFRERVLIFVVWVLARVSFVTTTVEF